MLGNRVDVTVRPKAIKLSAKVNRPSRVGIRTSTPIVKFVPILESKSLKKVPLRLVKSNTSSAPPPLVKQGTLREVKKTLLAHK